MHVRTYVCRCFCVCTFRGLRAYIMHLQVQRYRCFICINVRGNILRATLRCKIAVRTTLLSIALCSLLRVPTSYVHTHVVGEKSSKVLPRSLHWCSRIEMPRPIRIVPSFVNLYICPKDVYEPSFR